jgi:hypothetical protein
MQKQKKLIIIGVVTVALLSARMFLLQFNKYDREIAWYRDNLGYEFSCRVDSVRGFTPEGKGLLYCSLVEGQLQYHREDSLGRFVKYYEKLRFLSFEGSVIKIFSSATQHVFPGDSIYVSSGNDIFRHYRQGSLLREHTVYDAILKRYF